MKSCLICTQVLPHAPKESPGPSPTQWFCRLSGTFSLFVILILRVSDPALCDFGKCSSSLWKWGASNYGTLKLAHVRAHWQAQPLFLSLPGAPRHSVSLSDPLPILPPRLDANLNIFLGCDSARKGPHRLHVCCPHCSPPPPRSCRNLRNPAEGIDTVIEK